MHTRACRILVSGGFMCFSVRPTFYEETKDEWATSIESADGYCFNRFASVQTGTRGPSSFFGVFFDMCEKELKSPENVHFCFQNDLYNISLSARSRLDPGCYRSSNLSRQPRLLKFFPPAMLHQEQH